jgi:uncharacterized protein YjbJ (UPF0337 family)
MPGFVTRFRLRASSWRTQFRDLGQSCDRTTQRAEEAAVSAERLHRADIGLAKARLARSRRIRSIGLEDVMNEDQIKGSWNEFKGKVKEQWGKLTDDDLLQIEGDQDQLIGQVQRRYGIAREEAEKQVRDFMRRH